MHGRVVSPLSIVPVTGKVFVTGVGADNT